MLNYQRVDIDHLIDSIDIVNSGWLCFKSAFLNPYVRRMKTVTIQQEKESQAICGHLPQS